MIGNWCSVSEKESVNLDSVISVVYEPGDKPTEIMGTAHPWGAAIVAQR